MSCRPPQPEGNGVQNSYPYAKGCVERSPVIMPVQDSLLTLTVMLFLTLYCGEFQAHKNSSSRNNSTYVLSISPSLIALG